MTRLSLRNALGAAVLAGLTGLVLLLISAQDAGKALEAFLFMPVQNPLFFTNLIEQSALILLCALGFSITFRSGAFNLGGEGQFVIGALAAALFAQSFPWLPLPVSVILGAGFSALCAGSIGGLVGLLRAQLGVSEVISSFLFSLALVPLVDWAVAGPLRDQASNTLSTMPIPAGFVLPKISIPTFLSIGIFASLAAALLTWFVLRHSLFGFDSRVIRSNPEFGRTQGVPIGRRLFIAFILGAAFHGIAGATAVFGSYHAAFAGMSSGIAWAGIAAALIAKAHPLAAITGSVLLAYVQTGAQAAMMYTDISKEITMIMQGVFFLFITARTLGANRD